MLSPHLVFTWLVRPSLPFLLCLSWKQGYRNKSGRRVTRVTKFCTVGPHIFGSPVWNWLVPIFFFICGPLVEWTLQTISRLQKFGCILCGTYKFHSHVFQIGVCLSTVLSQMKIHTCFRIHWSRRN